MSRLNSALALTAAVTLLVSCGRTADQFRSDPLQREISLNGEARHAFARGEYDRAIALYGEALQISRAIEHIEGTATNLVNLAVVYRAAGEREEAARAAAEILETAPVDYPAEKKAEAAYVTALLALDEDDPAGAGERAARALAYCRGIPCPPEGRIMNLRSRIALRQHRYEEAMKLGGNALSLNRRQKNFRETANSLRTMAEAEKALGRHERAILHLEEALEIDKELGMSRKIALDLLDLGDLEKKLGHREEARRYYERALAVSEGAGDVKGAGTASTRLETLSAPPIP